VNVFKDLPVDRDRRVLLLHGLWTFSCYELDQGGLKRSTCGLIDGVIPQTHDWCSGQALGF